MKYGNLLLLSLLYTATSTAYSIPKPPEMKPIASATELLNARMEILDRDGEAVEVVLKGEVELGENDCLAENNEGYLIQKSRDVSPNMTFEAIVFTSFIGKGKCPEGRLNPIFKTLEKTLWIEEGTEKVIIKNPVQEDKPTEFFLRGENKVVRDIEFQFVKMVDSGKSIYTVSGEIFMGSNDCLAEGGKSFFSVYKLESGKLRIFPHVNYSNSLDDDKQCPLVYSPQWSPTSVDVEVDSIDDISVANISFLNSFLSEL